jgi:hypothetical protein
MEFTNLFSEIGFRFSTRFQRGTPADYFRDGSAHEALVAERRRWLSEEPGACAALLPEGGPLLDETLELAREWRGARFEEEIGSDDFTPLDRCLGLGRMWEPDFLLLKPDENGMPTLLGACVCFPSSWAVEEKMGKSIEFIHDVVPGLNEAIGDKIRNFLQRMRPGVAWLRANWGLSRSPELNQHPRRGLPRLDANATLDEIWLRVERQALVALPKAGGVLFGIRIETCALSELQRDSSAAAGLVRDLETMPVEMADYKNITAVRSRVVELLTRV